MSENIIDGSDFISSCVVQDSAIHGGVHFYQQISALLEIKNVDEALKKNDEIGIFLDRELGKNIRKHQNNKSINEICELISQLSLFYICFQLVVIPIQPIALHLGLPVILIVASLYISRKNYQQDIFSRIDVIEDCIKAQKNIHNQLLQKKIVQIITEQ